MTLPTDTLRAQREARIEQIKEAIAEMVRREHDAPPDLKVEILPDAVIDLFTLEIIDGEEKDFQEFLDSLRSASPDPLEDDE